MSSDAFKKFGISKDELEKMIQSEAAVDSALNDFMENEGVPYARSQCPVDTGKTAASIKVTKKAKRGKGEFGSKAWWFKFVEYGTKADSKGPDERRVLTSQGWKTLPKDTPTQAAAPMEKTAQHFGGNLGKGIAFDGDDE
jgi:hypothetical protein